MKRSLITTLLALVVTMGAIGQAGAQAKPEFTLRYGGYLAAKDPTNTTMEKMAALVAQRSNGRMKIDVFADGKLGNEREVTEAVRLGNAELVATLGTGLAQYVPEVGVLELPFTSTDSRVATQMFLEVMPDVAKLSIPKGFRPLTAWDIGMRGLLTKKPVRKIEDLAGMKMRGPAPLYLGTLKAMGANPAQMAWTDIYVALQTGAIDGMEASPQMIQPSRFQEQAKFYALTRHIDPGYYLLVSESYWQKLPADLQQILTTSARDAYAELRDNSDKIWNEFGQKMKAEGVEFIELKDYDKWVKSTDAFRVDYAKKLGPAAIPLYDSVRTSVEKGEKQYGIKK